MTESKVATSNPPQSATSNSNPVSGEQEISPSFDSAEKLSRAEVARQMNSPRLSRSDVLRLQRTVGNQAVMRMLEKRRQAEKGADAAPSPAVQRDFDYSNFQTRGEHTLFDKQVPTTLKNFGVAKITTNHVIPHNKIKALAANVQGKIAGGGEEGERISTAFRGLLGDAVKGAFELKGTKRAVSGASDKSADFLRFEEGQYQDYINNPTDASLPNIKQDRWAEFKIKGSSDKAAKTKAAMEKSINEMFTWMPWNLFKGPVNSQRFDDPGEGFEENSAPIIGFDTFTHLKLAYDNITDDPATAIAEIREAKQTREKQDVIEFKPNQWVTALEHFKEENTLKDKFKFKNNGPGGFIGPLVQPDKPFKEVVPLMMAKATEVLDSFLRLKEMEHYEISAGVLKRAVSEARQAAIKEAAVYGYNIAFED